MSHTSNLIGWLRHWADMTPDRTAVRFQDRTLSYRAFYTHCQAMAEHLQDHYKVKPGDRVAHLGYNSSELLALVFACAKIGAVLVPLNWRLAPPEHRYMLENAGVGLLLIDGEFTGPAGEAAPDIPAVVIDDDRDDWRPTVDQIDPDFSKVDAEPAEQPAMIVYTSGTTGRPKGAIISQDAITWNAINAVSAFDMTSADEILTILPMFHVGGMQIHTLPALFAGAGVQIIARFDPERTWQAIEEDRPSLLLAVPAAMNDLLAHPAAKSTDLSCLRTLTTGSTPVPEAVIRPWHDLGVPVSQVYGMTESGPVSIVLRADAAFDRVTSCGKPTFSTEARIVDSIGRDLPVGTSGEILLRASNLFAGYWQNDEATSAAFSDGWFHTGDVGHQDDDGYYYIDERITDVIISGGENIYPAELENILADIPDLAEAAVIGIPDEKWGEIPVICAVPAENVTLDGNKLLAHFDGLVARYKRPHQVHIMESLPRNAMGKILKYVLRSQIKPASVSSDG